MWGTILLAGAVASQPGPTVPVGLVTGVRGEVVATAADAVVAAAGRDIDVFRTRKLAVGDHLLLADRVSVPTGATLSVLLLTDGRRYQVKPGHVTVVRDTGFQPPDSADIAAGPAPDAGVLKTLRSAYSNLPVGRAAVGGLKTFQPRVADPLGNDTKLLPAQPETPRWLLHRVSPINSSTVLSARPSLRWAGYPGARYQVKVFAESRSEVEANGFAPLWTAQAYGSLLAYPSAEKALTPGNLYRWRVTANVGGDSEVVAEAEFRVATVGVTSALEKVSAVAVGDDAVGWLVAAQAFEAYDVYDRSLPLFERLAAASPRVEYYQERLVFLYDRAGWPGASRLAEQRLRALRPPSRP